MTEQVLGLERPSKTDRTPRAPSPASAGGRAWPIVMIAGLALAIVGWLDVILLWIPPDIGNTEWEFGTISSMFDAMPLGTIGIAFLAAGGVALARRKTLMALSVVCWLVTALLVGAVGLYLLDVPVAWQGVQPALHNTLRIAIVKTSISAAAYMALFAWLGWFTWKRARSGA